VARTRNREGITERLKLRADQLRLTPTIPDEAGHLGGIAGQDRAREAIAFGLRVKADGYNVVVAGAPASGRNTLVMELVTAAATNLPPAPDWIYVHNFNDPRRPAIFRVPPGTGDDLSAAMDTLVEACRDRLPAAFTGEAYERRVQDSLAPVGSARGELLTELERTARELGFATNPTPMGLLPVPLGADGHPLSEEAFAALTETEHAELQARGERVQELIAEAMRGLRRLDGEARERIRTLDREVARLIVGPILDELRQSFGAAGLGAHLDAVEADIAGNVDTFKRLAATGEETLPPAIAQQVADEREAVLRKYQVNLFVTHGPEAQSGGPVVDERTPSAANLFGRIEFENRFGTLITGFTHIRSGAVHLANGGFLVLQAQDLLSDPRSWPRLKHALKTGEVRMEEELEHLGIPVVSLAPMPMPLSLKVILVGPPLLLGLLDVVDPDFHELFKVRAEFEPDVPADAENIATYAAFARQTVERCALRPFEPSAIAEIVCYGSRLAARQDRLSTRLGLVGDLCTEASQVAADAGEAAVTGAHVAAAADARVRRAGMLPDRIRKMIAEGTLHVETSGSVVGQVNGLAVLATGDQAFGLPMRITCRTGAGQQGVVAIERETERSGSIHTKGVLVLNGFLTGTFGREEALAFNASLTFEQSYDEVEGDSASSAELYAILTSLADVPVRQDIAVTGSVDQFGNIQAVGGVTEKVEGFFDVCREIGLTGTQGVILPATNIRNLTLRSDIVEEVERDRFHLWAIQRVEEGIEILTGLVATAPTRGRAAEGAVFDRVAARLSALRASAAGQAETASDGNRRTGGRGNRSGSPGRR